MYAPDYVVNAGGLYNVYGEIHDWTPEQSREKIGEIYETSWQRMHEKRHPSGWTPPAPPAIVGRGALRFLYTVQSRQAHFLYPQ